MSDWHESATLDETRAIYTDDGKIPLANEAVYETWTYVTLARPKEVLAAFRALGHWGYRQLVKDEKNVWKLHLRLEMASKEEKKAFHARKYSI